jgi:photosystem II stability/assembly factor-like uncharacterized protein
VRTIILVLSLVAALWAAPVAAAETRYRVLVPLAPSRSTASSNVVTQSLARAPVLLHGIAARGRSAWAVGEQRFVTATRDGGATWQAQLEPQVGSNSFSFYGAAAASDQVAWAVGGTGMGPEIFGTRDGGATWGRQDLSAGGGTLRAVSSGSPGIAWAVGDAGIIFATTDGSKWHPQSSGIASDLLGVAALSPTTALVAGYDGLILGTTDGGAHWSVRLNTTSPKDSANTGMRLFGLSFANATNGWAVGLELFVELDAANVAYEKTRAVVFATRDGGITWTQQAPPPGVRDLSAVAAVSATEAWAGGSAADLVVTRDGGVTWLQAPSDGNNAYEAMAHGDGDLWGVGDYSVRSIATGSGDPTRR